MVIDKKCQNCGGIIHFNPEIQKMECDHCGNMYEVREESHEEVEKVQNYYDVYTCPNCGAQIVADPNTTSTFCVYCKNTAILKDKMQGSFAPKLIIPFKKTKKEAIVAWIELRKGRKLIPDTFLDEKNIEEIKPVYIPFWLFSLGLDGDMTGTGQLITATPTPSGEKVITDTYSIIRKGDIAFNRIPVDGSIHFDDAIMQSIEPFKYEDLVPYSSDYLSGFYSELYDVSSEDAYATVLSRINKSAYSVFYDSIANQGYTNIKIKEDKFKTKNRVEEYVLLPVWLLNVKYNDKLYPFAMNGQTGEMIGDIPYDKKKAIKQFIIYLVILLVIGLILGIILWKAWY